MQQIQLKPQCKEEAYPKSLHTHTDTHAHIQSNKGRHTRTKWVWKLNLPCY